MATIRARKQSDGTTRYTAIVRVPLQASIYSTRRLTGLIRKCLGWPQRRITAPFHIHANPRRQVSVTLPHAATLIQMTMLGTAGVFRYFP